jgi:hypothetical protein
MGRGVYASRLCENAPIADKHEKQEKGYIASFDEMKLQINCRYATVLISQSEYGT